MNAAPAAAHPAAGPAKAESGSGGLEHIVNSSWIATPVKAIAYGAGIILGGMYGSAYADAYASSLGSWTSYVMPILGATAGQTLGVVAGGLVGYGAVYALYHTASWFYHALFGSKKNKKHLGKHAEKLGGHGH
ncbi:hypothetical protein HYW21_09415 [Candidatus Woesearchaeota archaeon]|nr:hypothetical protein [Candidatus Woesearchaeota archaeon]